MDKLIYVLTLNCLLARLRWLQSQLPQVESTQFTGILL
jgi:hypothetical protein